MFFLFFFYTAALVEYMKYITELDFESKPNYSYLRSLFQPGTNQESKVPTCLFNIHESNENTCATSIRRPYLRERKPCRPVNGEVTIKSHKLFLIASYKTMLNN